MSKLKITHFNAVSKEQCSYEATASHNNTLELDMFSHWMKTNILIAHGAPRAKIEYYPPASVDDIFTLRIPRGWMTCDLTMIYAETSGLPKACVFVVASQGGVSAEQIFAQIKAKSLSLPHLVLGLTQDDLKLKMNAAAMSSAVATKELVAA